MMMMMMIDPNRYRGLPMSIHDFSLSRYYASRLCRSMTERVRERERRGREGRGKRQGWDLTQSNNPDGFTGANQA